MENASYNLKQKHQGIKRSIKFDDVQMDLVLDFCTDQNAGWKRITAVQAKAMKAKMGAASGKAAEITDSELDDLLNQQ